MLFELDFTVEFDDPGLRAGHFLFCRHYRKFQDASLVTFIKEIENFCFFELSHSLHESNLDIYTEPNRWQEFHNEIIPMNFFILFNTKP